MDRKGTRLNRCRANRVRKRKFQGNQHTIEAEIDFASTSTRKLSLREDILVTQPSHSYRILNFISIFAAISQMVICRECKKDVQFGENRNRELGFNITIICDCCVKTIESCYKINKAFEINRRIVMVMRLGISREDLNLFCEFMDLYQGLSKNAYNAALINLHDALSAIFDALTKKAIEEEKEANTQHNKPSQDLSVSGDGSWKKKRV
jgi:hypothetical protein